MPLGRVKWFNDKKGFGFIVTEEDQSNDIFVHYTSIRSDGFKSLNPGDQVNFELMEGPKGLQAHNVSRVFDQN